ncbi:MAG TPA: alpha/beta fold hydrolase [Cyanophyceae cyanobacterium]
MFDYAATTTAIIEQAKAREDALPIRNEKCRSKFYFQPHPAPKVCLFFHGFTAGSYQVEPLAETLFQAGYNVLVPLQPGHGIAGDWNSDNPPPLPEDLQVYKEFVLGWIDTAKSLGQKLILGGYSTGGTLAAWAAQNYPQYFEKTLLFAPYLSSKLIITNWLIETLPVYYEWLNKDNPGNFGYKGFHIPAARILLDMGQEILDRAKTTPATPMLIVSSESDQAVNRHDHRELFDAVLNYHPESWYYCFDKKLDIPHTMMTEQEGNHYLAQLLTLAKAYIESDLTWHQVQEIAHHMSKGQSFNVAVADMNLHQPISPELPVMMTILDKQAIEN